MTRAELLAAAHAAIAACDPAARVARALRGDAIAAALAGRRVLGIAAGKAALAMAHGAGPVARGVVVVPAGAATEAPAGWGVLASAHPLPDARSVAAARAARALVDAAGEGDVVLALISGGASALLEEPIAGVTIEELAERTRAAMHAGLPIAELNALRASLSRTKRGGLVAGCAAPVVTLAISDVIGDDLAVIGSGPTIGAWLAGAPAEDGVVYGAPPRAGDRARVVARMDDLAHAAVQALAPRRVAQLAPPLAGDVTTCADRIVAACAEAPDVLVAWGEPTLVIPADHGEGGRAQQLALHLARALRGTPAIALVLGSDGIDGPPPRGRPAPAGAVVDGTTWDAIAAAGSDPEAALARCDAGTALAAAGALVITGPTGINHADLVIVEPRAKVL